MRNAIILAMCIVVAGCAGNRPDRCMTARAIKPGLDPAQVTISDRKRGLTTSRWNAQTPDGLYQCRGDYMYGAVRCSFVRAAPQPAPAVTPAAPAPGGC